MAKKYAATHAVATPIDIRSTSPATQDEQPHLDPSICIEPARRAVARVARRFRLSPADAEDLHGDLWVRVLAKDGLLIRQFRRAALMESYLTKVATHLCIDNRRKVEGKWRPSARARRSGRNEIAVEKLVDRDGLTPEAAIAKVAARVPDADKEALMQFADRIVPKWRARARSPEPLPLHPTDCESPRPTPFDALSNIEATRAAVSVSAALNAALLGLGQADRDLIIWRYGEGRSVIALAEDLGLDHKVLYRRFERLVRRLRADLQAAGLSATAVSDLLDNNFEVACTCLRTRPQSKSAFLFAEGRPGAPALRVVVSRTNATNA